MKTVKFFTLFFSASLFVSSVNAQTADEIVKKYFEALGGMDKISQIKTMYMENSVEIMGNTTTNTVSLINGKAYKSVFDFNGTQIIQVYTDTSGWSVNPMTGSSTPVPMSPEEYEVGKNNIFAAGQLFDYASRGYTVHLLGRDSINGKNAYKLNLISADSTASTLYIDPETYYLVRAEKEINGQQTTMDFSNYKKTDVGFVMPFTTELSLPQGISLTINTTKIEINNDIDPSIFKMPEE